MRADCVAGYYSSQLYYTSVIAVRQDPCVWYLGRQQGLGPWLRTSAGGPGPLAVTRETMNKDEAVDRSDSRTLPVSFEHQMEKILNLGQGQYNVQKRKRRFNSLHNGMFRIAKHLEAVLRILSPRLMESWKPET